MGNTAAAASSLLALLVQKLLVLLVQNLGVKRLQRERSEVTCFTGTKPGRYLLYWYKTWGCSGCKEREASAGAAGREGEREERVESWTG